jgi:DNA transformation protein
MSKEIEALPNLGPASARWLEEIGVETTAQLRAAGAVATWKRLRFQFDRAVNINALYALEGALTGCDWRDLPPEAIARLRAQAGLPPRRAKTHRRP